MSTPLPEYPWQIVGTDLFEVKNEHYLQVVDYFSHYLEVIKLASTTSTSVIKALQAIFSRHGIPETVRSDASQEFTQFAKSYGFSHTMSSARYPQSNGQAERMVQTVKRMLRQSKDPHMALLSYRATPMPWCSLSPAELLMGRFLMAIFVLTTTMTIIPDRTNHFPPCMWGKHVCRGNFHQAQLPWRIFRGSGATLRSWHQLFSSFNLTLPMMHCHTDLISVFQSHYTVLLEDYGTI